MRPGLIRNPLDHHLNALNAAQRQAVEHGIGSDAGPLLVIAGAGSGKTNTLAHRVAHPDVVRRDIGR